MATTKKKIGLYVERETWEQLNAVLKKHGYPRGVPSWIAQRAFENTTLQLEHGADTQLDLFFDKKP